jgi:hypothetical protein
LVTEYGSHDSESVEYKKRTLRVPDLLNEIPKERAVYPKGIVTSLKESAFDSMKVGRIELFSSKDNEKGQYYGILKQLFVAFSSESRILKLAITSSNVIEVHGLREDKENKKGVVESKLVLKRSEEAAENEEQKQQLLSLYGEKTPKLFVSSHWLDLMNLSSGDRVIISNPRENYEIPPPLVS